EFRPPSVIEPRAATTNVRVPTTIIAKGKRATNAVGKYTVPAARRREVGAAVAAAGVVPAAVAAVAELLPTRCRGRCRWARGGVGIEPPGRWCRLGRSTPWARGRCTREPAELAGGDREKSMRDRCA